VGQGFEVRPRRRSGIELLAGLVAMMRRSRARSLATADFGATRRLFASQRSLAASQVAGGFRCTAEVVGPTFLGSRACTSREEQTALRLRPATGERGAARLGDRIFVRPPRMKQGGCRSTMVLSRLDRA
jgi:hypothetical protein